MSAVSEGKARSNILVAQPAVSVGSFQEERSEIYFQIQVRVPKAARTEMRNVATQTQLFFSHRGSGKALRSVE